VLVGVWKFAALVKQQGRLYQQNQIKHLTKSAEQEPGAAEQAPLALLVRLAVKKKYRIKKELEFGATF